MRCKHTVDDYAIVGWGAARTILERCKDPARRELLVLLARQASIQGAPGMDYTARLLRYYIAEAELPAPRRALSATEVSFIEQRVREVLGPYVKDGDPRLPPRLHGNRRGKAGAA